MRHLLLALAALAATDAVAGGLDLSGQPITLLFHDGDYAEVAIGAAWPSLSGTDAAGTPSGNVYGPVADFGAGVVRQLGSRWSAALILDLPYGVAVDYPRGTGFPFAGTHAKPESLEVTGLLRYRIDDRFSLHGGLRAERFGGEATLDGWGYGQLAGYNWTGDPDWGLGYVVGGAYEIPEIALRVALTYGSEIRHALDADENYFGPTTTDVTMPQSVNLDLQTGIAEDMLLYGLVRWVNWDGWKVQPAGLYAATGLPLIEFDSDSFTYRLGVARQFTDALSAGVEVTHETPKNTVSTALDPYDGFTSLGLGAAYTRPSGLTVGGGAALSLLGDADVVGPGGVTARFSGNRALAARLKVGLAF